MSEADDPRPLQAYRAANAALDEAPSPSARAAILAAAVRAAEPRPPAKPSARHWRLPLAAAASLLVGAIAVLLATRVDTPQPPPAARAPAVADAAGRTAEAPGEVAQPPAAAGPSEPSAPPAGPAATAPPAAEKARIDRAQPADAQAVASAPAGAGAERAAPAAAPRATAQPRPAAPESVAAAWRRAPQTWIEHIVRLRAQGRHDEADAELARLRAQHPTLEIPASVLHAGRADR